MRGNPHYFPGETCQGTPSKRYFCSFCLILWKITQGNPHYTRRGDTWKYQGNECHPADRRPEWPGPFLLLTKCLHFQFLFCKKTSLYCTEGVANQESFIFLNFNNCEAATYAGRPAAPCNTAGGNAPHCSRFAISTGALA